MDIFFQNSHQDYLNTFNLLASDENFDPQEVINENDDKIHDFIELEVYKNARILKELNYDISNQPIPDVSQIVSNFQCSFCMDTVINPVVIKYCLHFFCKDCIELYIRQQQLNLRDQLYFYSKKECPLCKETLKTKRELRRYEKIEAILRLLRPKLEQAHQKEQQEFKQAKENQLKEQQDLTKLLDKQMVNCNKKRSSIEFDLDEENIENLDQLEDEEQIRIRKKVEKLRAMNQREQMIMNQYLKLQATNLEDATMICRDDQKYFKNYEHIKKQLVNEDSPKLIQIKDKPPKLDIRVRILFDEDLKTMIFPKIKEFLFRVNLDSPIEIAAKALAIKNQHSNQWCNYTFSYIKKLNNGENLEIEIKELSQSFSILKEYSNQEELVLFYRIKDLTNIILEDQNMNFN